MSVSARKLHVVVGICQNILSSITLDKESTFHKFLGTSVVCALTELLSSSDILCVLRVPLVSRDAVVN